MSLYDPLPESVEIDGVAYPIDADFRVWSALYERIEQSKTDEAKADALTDFLVHSGLPTTMGAVDAVLDFFSRGIPHASRQSSRDGPRAFDFLQDSDYIYAAFREVYQIDLSTECLHWHAFLALFRGLPDNCQLCKIMHYRTAKMSDIPKSQRKFYQKMKERYQLDQSQNVKKTVEQRNEEWKRRIDEAYKKAKMQMSTLRDGEQPGYD